MSEAEKLRRILAAEKKRPLPDDELVYAIKVRLPYANTVDTEKLRRGEDKLNQLLAQTRKSNHEPRHI